MFLQWETGIIIHKIHAGSPRLTTIYSATFEITMVPNEGTYDTCPKLQWTKFQVPGNLPAVTNDCSDAVAASHLSSPHLTLLGPASHPAGSHTSAIFIN